MAVPALKDTVFHVETRREAIEALAQGADVAIHDHETNPLIYRAASELIMRDDRGQKTDIRATGLPHQVLSDVADELRALGISMFASSQVLEALEGYAIGLGADFAREAQAKPLYARVVVTEKKPDDIPDCELVQATLIDGQRRVGDGVSQRVMQSTIYGTRTSMTKEMNLDAMFASSKKKWLLIYYGSPSGETYKGLDSVDVSLINLMQGLGGKIPPDVIEDINTALQAGNLSPAHIEIIEDFATIEKILEPFSRGETLPPEIQTKLSGLVSDVSVKIDSIQDYAVPLEAVLVSIAENNGIILPQPAVPDWIDMAANDETFNPPDIDEIIIAVEKIAGDETIPGEVREKIVEVLAELKDAVNQKGKDINLSLDKVASVLVGAAAIEGISLPLFQSISSMLPMIIEAKDVAMHTPLIEFPEMQTVVELVKAISQSIKMEQNAGHDLPPHMVEIIENLAVIERMTEGRSVEETVKLFAEALKNPTSDPFSIEVQTLMLSLAQPRIQTALQSLPSISTAKNEIAHFQFQNAEIIQVAASSMMIRAIEARLSGGEPVLLKNSLIEVPALEPAELRQVLQIIKAEGISGLVTKSPQSQSTQMSLDVIERVLKSNPEIAEIALTAVITEDFQRKLQGGSIEKSSLLSNLSLEPAEIKAALHILKSEGVTGLIGENGRRDVSPTIRDAVTKIGRENPSVMEAVITGTMIRDIETQLSGGATVQGTNSPLLGMEPAELKQVLQILKQEGSSGLMKPDVLAKMNPVMAETVATMAIIREVERTLSGTPSQNASLSTFRVEPAELKRILDVIKADGVAVLLQPENQVKMTPSMRQAVNQFMQKNPAVIEVAVTTAMIRDIEMQLSGGATVQGTNPPLLRMEPAELKQVLQILKQEGSSGLMKPDVLAKMTPTMAETVATMAIIREVESKMNGASSHNASLSIFKVEPAELKKILDVIKADGVAGLLQPENQVQMTPSMRQAVNHFMRKNPTLAEAAVSTAMVRELAKISPSSGQRDHITPTERQKIIQAIQRGGMSALVEKGFSESLGEGAKQVVLTLSTRVLPSVGANQALLIEAEIRRHYDTGRNPAQPTQAVQDIPQKTLWASFHADHAQQDRPVIAVLTKVLSQPSQNIPVQEYERNLKVLDTVISHISARPGQDLKTSIAELIKSPEGLADVNALLKRFESSPIETLSGQEKISVMAVRQAILEVKIEHDITKNEHLSDEAKAKAIEIIHTALNGGNTEDIQKNLASARDVLHSVGVTPPDTLKDLQSVVGQKVIIEKGLNAFTLPKKPWAFVPPEAKHNITIPKSSVIKPSARPECIGGPNCPICTKLFNKEAEGAKPVKTGTVEIDLTEHFKACTDPNCQDCKKEKKTATIHVAKEATAQSGPVELDFS